MSAMKPSLDDIERRFGALPKRLPAEAADHADPRDAAARGEVLMKSRSARGTPGRLQGDHDEVIARWRAHGRAGRRGYRARASLCELTNAHLRNRGLTHFLVRGVAKAGCGALIAAIAADLLAHSTSLLA